MATPAFSDRQDHIRTAVETALAEDGRKWFVDAKIGNNSLDAASDEVAADGKTTAVPAA